MLGVAAGNKVALHAQVARTLKQRLQCQVYQPGQTLPSYRELSKEFSVSLGVVQRAVNDLAGAGLLAIHQGKRIVVPERAREARVGIAFGLIEPFVPGIAFDMGMALHAERVFSDRDNFLILRSSQAEAAREREVAEQMARNGVQGLILWPVSNDENATFLRDLARRIPIILVDRTLEGVDLPAVIHDFHAWGGSIIEQVFDRGGRRRLLVLMDDLNISTYRDLTRGLREGCAARGRMADMTIVSLPISQFVGDLKRGELGTVDDYVALVGRHLREGGYDAVFCFQDEFVEAVLIDSGLHRDFAGVEIHAACDARMNNRMPSYLKAGVVQWAVDYPGMIMQAAEQLQHAVLSRSPLAGITRLDIALRPASRSPVSR